ncbi:hypothetical protein [Fusibacter sp. 3D3]|uniref:hypothetical protein n=1 Tax=Fusibacter sp. 3D3 TaxID=1048380 RepID=UPI000852E54C|nr:hypothetical protein [Fusibacter sp. 3D3]GAU77058.1 hypothetical protein F3D3_1657 [Fusibacter sp. 3D3]
MPYRGTNAKRQVVHAKSKNTLRDGAKDHYHFEKKELEHELSQNKIAIQKLLNDGYRYERAVEEGPKTIVHFINNDQHRVEVCFDYSENVTSLKDLYVN